MLNIITFTFETMFSTVISIFCSESWILKSSSTDQVALGVENDENVINSTYY